jgi:hypothetical protein
MGLWGCGQRGALSTNPQAGCRNGSRSQFLVIAQVSLRVVIGQPMWPVKDRQAAVGVLVHAHGGADKMGAQRAWRDLQAEPAPFDRVVVADPALLLEAQDLARGAAAVGDERGSGLLRRHREPGVVGRQISFADPPVGGLERGDPGQGQLLGEAVLQGAEGALGTAARLRRVGRDVAVPSCARALPTCVRTLFDTASPALGV